ncbi:YwqI/YxiC family protein [Sporosarcina sp. Te-1]|uniref:YwqI/YxiC family protein n=1 Tax=Sporosarcina sp. Te-1 TaxID=2818390 RepID=UPI001A9D2D8F|nr:YwqI/YxiC family protein [Sporosarcina sp. Te-1]QTD39744.1 YwqI/YxiC family protein [Sporosarcina sp. Te-1]
MTEMKIVYEEVESKLGEIQGATEELDPTAVAAITQNQLDVVTKLTELQSKLETLLTNYQTLLKKNVETTENSVQFLRAADETIGKGIAAAQNALGLKGAIE